jgi:hypothetical protein
LAHAIIPLYSHVHGCRRTVELRSGGYEVGGSRAQGEGLGAQFTRKIQKLGGDGQGVDCFMRGSMLVILHAGIVGEMLTVQLLSGGYEV